MLVDEIISNLKLKAGFPDDNYFSDANLLSILNDEQKVKILPLLLKLKAGYYIKNKTYTITAGSTYRLPGRAAGSKVRDIKLLSGSDYSDLNQLFEEDRQYKRRGYYINGNSIELSSDIISGTLVATYYLTPSKLILAASAAKVSTIVSATQVTVEALPSTFAVNGTVDFVQANQPCDMLSFESTITNIASTTLTFASLSSDLAVGDYICIAGQTPVPLMPEELHILLGQAALVTCLRSKKNKSAKEAKEDYDKILEDLTDMLAPRSDSNDVIMRGQGFLGYLRLRR